MRERVKRCLLVCAGLILWAGIGVGSMACSVSEPAESFDSADGTFPEGIAKEPVILTSGGQSADIHVVDILLKKGEIHFDRNELLYQNELDGYKTLVIALGGSTKGLASAGIRAEEELERLHALISAAEEKDMKLVVLHIGGSSRRGEVSDLFLPDVLSAADAAIILAEGDEDGKIWKILEENQVPSLYVDSQAEAIEPLAGLFEK